MYIGQLKSLVTCDENPQFWTIYEYYEVLIVLCPHNKPDHVMFISHIIPIVRKGLDCTRPLFEILYFFIYTELLSINVILDLWRI